MIYVYVRMSHKSSAESGVSEEMQISAAMRYIKSHLPTDKLATAHYPEDGPPGFFIDRATSSWKKNLSERPGGVCMLSHLKPGDHIIFYNIERAYRNVSGFAGELESLIKQGITPHFIMEKLDFSSASGRMLARMMAVMAEYYSDMISERTKEALRIKRLTGSAPSKLPRTRFAPSDVYIHTPKKVTPKSSGKVRIYIRCSHVDSEISGLGLESQRRACSEYAKIIAEDYGCEVHPEYYEDVSISAFHTPFEKREAGARLLADTSPNDHIVTYRCDRAFRMPHDAALVAKELRDKNIFIHLVDCGVNTATPMGMLYLNMLAVFASIESQIKSARNKEIADIARKNGRPAGPPPKYCNTIVGTDGVKRLEYDQKKMAKLCAMSLIIRLYNRSEIIAEKLANQVMCNYHDMPTINVLRRKKLYISLISARRDHQTWMQLRGNIPKTLRKASLKKAIKLLTKPPSKAAQKYCTHIDYPLLDVASRLRAAQTHR